MSRIASALQALCKTRPIPRKPLLTSTSKLICMVQVMREALDTLSKAYLVESIPSADKIEDKNMCESAVARTPRRKPCLRGL